MKTATQHSSEIKDTFKDFRIGVLDGRGIMQGNRGSNSSVFLFIKVFFRPASSLQYIIPSVKRNIFFLPIVFNPKPCIIPLSTKEPPHVF